MKTILAVSFLSFLYHLSLGQNINSTSVNVSGDSVEVRIVAYFPYGALDFCPQLQSHDITYNNNQAFLNLYYNTSGFWPQDQCESLDTIYISDLVAGNTYNLSVIANEVFF